MKWQKLTKVGITVLAAGLFLAACGSSKNSASNNSNVLRRMEGDVISTMDPSKNTDAISGQALIDTMDGLYRYNGDKLEPAIATSIAKASADGKSYTIKLRKDAKWSNGDKVTAKDFVFGWQRTVDPATASQYTNLFDGIANATDIANNKKDKSELGIKAIDDTTLQVTLDSPIPYFNSLMTNPVFFPQNESVVKKYGDKYGTNSDSIVSNGPFKLEKWNGTGNSWKEVKNKDYWNAKAVKLAGIEVQVIKDPSTALNLFQGGKMDDVMISGEIAQQMKNDPSFQGQKQASVFYLEMNETKAALKNIKVRQGISMALDNDQLVNKVLNDGSIAGKGIVPQGLFKKDGKDFATVANKQDSAYTKYDPAEAKKVFKEGLKEAGVSSLNLEILGDDTDGAKKMGEYLQSTLTKNLPDLKVTLSNVPFKTRLTRSTAGQFDLVVTAWGADFPDAISYLDLFTSTNSYNNGKWSNPDYDRLIQESKTTVVNDPEQRWDTLLQAQSILAKDYAIKPLYQRVQAHLVNKQLKEMNYSPTNSYNFVHTYFAK